LNSSNGTDLSIANADSKGFFTANRTANNVINGWKNATKVVSGTTLSNGTANANLVLSALNDGGNISNYSSKEIAFATLGSGLTDLDVVNFYNAIQNYQTILGRQV
jgi:hypothetical protein